VPACMVMFMAVGLVAFKANTLSSALEGSQGTTTPAPTSTTTTSSVFAAKEYNKVPQCISLNPPAGRTFFLFKNTFDLSHPPPPSFKNNQTTAEYTQTIGPLNDGKKLHTRAFKSLCVGHEGERHDSRSHSR
jgi:hypothetical protein